MTTRTVRRPIVRENGAVNDDKMYATSCNFEVTVMTLHENASPREAVRVK